MTIVKAASEQNVYSQIFRPITTARLQVVAEKMACTAGAIISLSIFCNLGGNEAKFGHAVNLWVGTRLMLK